MKRRPKQPRQRFMILVAVEARGAPEAWRQIMSPAKADRLRCFTCGAAWTEAEIRPRDLDDGLIVALCEECCAKDPAPLIARPRVVHRQPVDDGRAA